MNCPACDELLRAVQKYGVEVDICPDCKGVWLDRGEIDKIIEIASSGEPVRSEAIEQDSMHRAHSNSDQNHEGHDDRREHRDYADKRTSQSRRRGSWISDIFESFGGD